MAPAALFAFALASSMVSAFARQTPILRSPFTSGLPNILSWVSGSFNASSNPEKEIFFDLPLTKITEDADGPNWRIAGMGKPKMARTCKANSDKSCEIMVTMPVSCGRGDNSLK